MIQDPKTMKSPITGGQVTLEWEWREIVAVREKYGLSAAKMAAILGFGPNQWRKYEQEEIPSVSNGRMIRSIMNPKVFLDMVESAREVLKRVCSMLGGCSSRMLSEKSHQEKAWIENHEQHRMIPFEDAFVLRGM